MKRIIMIITAAAVMTVTCAESPTEPLSGWVYGGQLEYGPGTGEWPVQAMPIGVAALPKSGTVYVAVDYSTWRVPSCIRYFTPDGCYVGNWDGEEHAVFYDVVVSPSRNWVYVTDGVNHRIQYYTTVGSFLGEWAVNRPGRIAISPSDGNVYVAAGSSIQYFTATGSYLGEWGTEGSGKGQFKGPWGVAFAPDTGYVYVADIGNDRIQYFTSSGSFLGKWGATGSSNGDFKGPTGIAVSPTDGNVYTVDRDNNRIQYFTPDGSFVGKLGSYGSEKAQFRGAWALCFNGTGNRLYVTESPTARVQYFDYYK
jgi:DNA-binding beta-propeller fold protein YncE